MATISQQAGGVAAQEKPLLDKHWLAFGLGIYLVFYLNEWGHTFWFMEELFVAPLHYGFVVFGWTGLAIMGSSRRSSRTSTG